MSNDDDPVETAEDAGSGAGSGTGAEREPEAEGGAGSGSEAEGGAEPGSEAGGGAEPGSEAGGEAESGSEAGGVGETAHDEVYCSSCGEPIKRDAEVCPHCGVRQRGAGDSPELNPGISAIASLVIPGAGQLYNGQMGRGAVAFLGAIVADTLITVLALLLTFILIGPLFFFLIPVVHIGIAYDAYNQAERINAGEITV
ncbi:zinc ribbon domain-containing protein [Halorarum halobium]|uniref:zinc ribbon domain-containing protein n=1 Tax=Halorarum halobium TaxID=3075121 RepID=UPI0028AB9DBE|nr:zinc ribbon domain-containing protein [Halobaculum sp. XH14]